MSVYKLIKAVVFAFALGSVTNATMAKYIQSDPIGLQGGINTYGYVYASPLMYIDSMGLKPGDLFKNPDGAARDMFNYIQTNTSGGSYKSFIEYGQWVYQQNQCYTYDEPVGGTDGVLKPPPRPPRAVGFFHTHPLRGFLPDSPSADFSDKDVSKDNQKYYGTQWMGTNIVQPDGTLKPRLRKNIPGKPSFDLNPQPQKCDCP